MIWVRLLNMFNTFDYLNNKSFKWVFEFNVRRTSSSSCSNTYVYNAAQDCSHCLQITKCRKFCSKVQMAIQTPLNAHRKKNHKKKILSYKHLQALSTWHAVNVKSTSASETSLSHSSLFATLLKYHEFVVRFSSLLKRLKLIDLLVDSPAIYFQQWKSCEEKNHMEKFPRNIQERQQYNNFAHLGE